MSKTKVSFFSLSIYISLLCNLGILIGNPLKIYPLVSLSTHVLIISIVGFALLTFLQQLNVRRTDRIMFLAFVVFLIVVLFTFAQGMSVVLNKYVSALCFLMLPSYIVLFYRQSCSQETKKAIYRIAFVYWLVFLYLSISELSHIGYNDWGIYQSKTLTLGFQNSNETGMMLFIPYVILLSAFADSDRVYRKVLSGLAVLHLLYLIIETKSRTCIILSVFIAAVFLFRSTIKIAKCWLTISILLPFVTLLFQMLFSDLLDNIIILGETADSGRIWLWSSFIDNTSIFEWLFGNVADYGGANMHNSYLSVVAAYGIVGFIPYLIFLWKSFNHYFVNLESSPINYSQRIAFVGLLGVIIHGCAEAAFFVSGTVYAGLVSLLFILALPERTESC